ncbi:uncharacterized protein LOC124935729 [Impatiens glandulifera]|uniref:uncharacterized protein LOC124935729 n=1 Tax=Impatiens glandulifera TaxID=253017 RepID=UPI001FB14B66|nr:uncharacterized protein LOC124935729 [Impatiens glandulifera]
MATTAGGSVAFSSFTSSPSYFSTHKGNTHSPLPPMVAKYFSKRRNFACFAAQESNTSAVTAETEEVKPEKKPARPKPAAKAPVKPLPEMMMEDVIPSLKERIETQEDITDLELSFQDNRLEGSFLKLGYPYSFWAFFPDGVITGPKGFSISSYGNEPSTVEPFLVDEKKITSKHVVFWVEKRLAAQGIFPVWKESSNVEPTNDDS